MSSVCIDRVLGNLGKIFRYSFDLIPNGAFLVHSEQVMTNAVKKIGRALSFSFHRYFVLPFPFHFAFLFLLFLFLFPFVLLFSFHFCFSLCLLLSLFLFLPLFFPFVALFSFHFCLFSSLSLSLSSVFPPSLQFFSSSFSFNFRLTEGRVSTMYEGEH